MENDKWLTLDIVRENEQLKKDKENLTKVIKKLDEELNKKNFEIKLLKKIGESKWKRKLW